MIVSLLCTSRSGSTNLSMYLSQLLNLKFVSSPFMGNSHSLDEINKSGFYKIFIHNQSIGFDSLYLFGESVINISDKVILYDRDNKNEQAESLAFKKTKYHSNLNNYHNREYYDISNINPIFLEQCLHEFNEHSIAIKQLSVNHNIPIFLYEDIYYNNGLEKLSEYLGVPINYTLKNKFLNLKNKERKSNIDLL